MSDKFDVGEVAIFRGLIDSHEKFNGSEVTVIGPLGPRVANAYEVNAPFLHAIFGEVEWFCAFPTNLRKRHPPPDWEMIAAGQPLQNGSELVSRRDLWRRAYGIEV